LGLLRRRDPNRRDALLKRILKGFGAVLSGQVLSTFGNLLLVPLFLSHWSTTVYGEWMALSAVIAYLNAADLGMNAAAGNKLLAAYSSRDWAAYRGIQGAAIAFYIALAAATTFICGVVCAVLPVASWLGIRSIPAVTAGVVAWVLATRTIWQMPVSQVASTYRTTGDLSITQWISNGQAIALILLTAVCVTFGGGVFSVAVSSIVTTALGGLVACWSVYCWRRNLIPSFSDIRVNELITLIQPSLLFGLMILAIALSVQGPVVLVSAFLGGTAVALLVTTRTLAFLVRQFFGMITAVLWPELTQLNAAGEEVTFRLVHRLLVALSVAVSCAFAGALWWDGPEVLRIWTRGRIASDNALLRLFLVSMVLQGPWVASAAFTTAINRHKKLSYHWFASAIIALICCSLLLWKIGVLAVPISGIIGEAIACYHFVIQDTCRAIGENYRKFALRIWPCVLLVFTASLIAGRIGHAAAVGPAPFRWIEVGLLSTIAAGIFAWYSGILAADRFILLTRLRRRLPIVNKYLQFCFPLED
jgi:O-antigen/teichoic acid export membrane protein